MGKVLEIKRVWETVTIVGEVVTVEAHAEYKADYSIAFIGNVPMLLVDDIPDVIQMLEAASAWVLAREKEDEEA